MPFVKRHQIKHGNQPAASNECDDVSIYTRDIIPNQFQTTVLCTYVMLRVNFVRFSLHADLCYHLVGMTAHVY